MPAIRPYRAFAHEQLIHLARDADDEAAHAARERRLVGGFDDEVYVIRLHGVVHDAKG
jgi:hypothetical protein